MYDATGVTEGTEHDSAVLHVLALAREQAAADWPGVAVDEARLRTVLAGCLEGPAGASSRRWGDLLLAHACAEGHPVALERFERAFATVAQRAFRGVGARDADLDDLWQGLKIRLLMGRGEAPARIASYAGRGSLEGWIKVSAVRFALNARGSTRDAVEELNDALEASAIASTELELAKHHYREAFRAAFRQALAGLPAQELVLLRQSLVHGMSARELGRAYDLHHTSISRRLASIRGQLLAATREALGAMLRLPASEVQSIFALIGSRLEASFRQLEESSE